MDKTVSFNKERYIKSEPIIIYGASVYGELAYIALSQMGLKPEYYCDRSKDIKEYFGVKVICPEELNNKKNANIIIASADFFYEIRKILKEAGCNHLFDMSEMLRMSLPKELLSHRAQEMYANRQHYIDIVENQSEEKIVFNRVQYVVSERCSLKCKDCTHLMPYYKYPQDVDLNKYRAAFNLLLENVDCIVDLRILGGEPFMNSAMGDIIEWYHDNRKIQGISVYTNGTIIPNKNILKALQKEKVKVHVSDYKINEDKIKNLVTVLDEFHIRYFVRTYDAWQDAGGMEFRNYSPDQKKEIFSHCFERNGFTFFKGKLHRCPRAAHAMNLRAIPDIKEDYVDLLDWKGTEEGLKVQLRNLQEKTWLESCNYCGGPNNHTQSIPAGRQVPEPIKYEAKY